MKKRLFFVLFVLFGCFKTTVAQQLYFNHLTVNNGLSQGVNNCIYRDSKGFVWVSSFDGLNRFDGMSCVSFRSAVNETEGLKGTLFLNILEDISSNLWIGSNSGLNFYNRRLDQFQNFRIEGRSSEDQFYSPFYIDDRNNIWLQSSSDIILFNPANKTFTLFNHFFPSGSLLVKPMTGKLYQPLNEIIAISNNRPVLWEGKVSISAIEWKSNCFVLPCSNITAIVPAGKDDLWLGTNKGVYLYKSGHATKYVNRFAGLEIGNISTLHLDQQGTLWAGTSQQGLFRIDTMSGMIKNHYEYSVYNSYALSGNQIQYIITDEKGDLWVSVWGKGVDYTSLSRFRFNHHVTKEAVLQAGSDNFLRSVVQVHNEIWCATQADGILILDADKNIKQSLRSGLPRSIEHLFVDKNEQVWASTFEGLFLIDPNTKKIIKLPVNSSGSGAAADQYNYISSLQNGSLLASTNVGLYSINKVKAVYQIKRAKGINSSRDVFLTTYTDKQGRVYISRAYKGFAVYRLAGDSLILLKDVPLEATIKCFSESTDSSLWIGSTLGLVNFNKYTLQIQQIYTDRDGLSNQYIYGIIPEGDNLWLSTNKGINRFTTATRTVKTFSDGDGLQSNEYNTYSFCKTDKGEILFGGTNGLNSFYPADFKNTSYAPQLILTGLQINDTAYEPVINRSEIDQLSVEYEQNTLGFQFTVIHYANAAANTLTYILEGFDKSWVTVSSKTLIRYANLPPGHYTLKVKAFNSDGIEALKPYSLPITVKVPWWQRWWFRLLLVLFFLGLVLFVVRSHITRRLEKQRNELEKIQAVEKERNRISHDMHDDIGSGLTIIAILSEVVKKQLSEPEKAREILDKIAVTSRDLVDNLQDIIWLLNSQNDTLESLSSYIREYGLKYFEPLSIQLEFHYPEQFSLIRLGEEQRRNVFLTVKESFNNIAKYAECKKIIVTIREVPDEILLSIEDDGRGFDVKRVRLFANGLNNMQKRIELVGGWYSITSLQDKGTITKIRLSV
ncbi:MAG: triple tyrosine motif-containing protein [Bacteroidota bacterium]